MTTPIKIIGKKCRIIAKKIRVPKAILPYSNHLEVKYAALFPLLLEGGRTSGSIAI